MSDSQGPNDQEREEKAQPENYRQAEPIKRRLANVFAVAAGVCTIVAAWALAENHRTTFVIVSILGVCFYILAGYCHWTPGRVVRSTTELLNKVATRLLARSSPPALETEPAPPNQPSKAEIIQAEYDRLSQEHVRTKLALERALKEKEQGRYETTPLQHNASADETETQRILEQKGQESSATQPKSDPHPHRHYTQEQIDDVIWRWSYKFEFDNEPRSITPHCRECERSLNLNYTQEVVIDSSNNVAYGICEAWCLAHSKVYRLHTGEHVEFASIKDHIMQRIKNGSWLPIVNRQRKARGEPPLADPNKPVYPPWFFQYGSGNLWTEYTQDEFYDVIWGWHYKPEIDNTPRDITPYCPQCQNLRPLLWKTSRHQQGKVYIISLECRVHPQMYSIRLDRNPYDKPFEVIKKRILGKLEDGEWIEVVNKHRMARSEAPLSPDIHIPRRLDEMKDLILLALWNNATSCDFQELTMGIGHQWFLKHKSEPRLDRELIKYHLQGLIDKPLEYVEVEYGRFLSYSLTQAGRGYVIKNLLSENRDSN